MSRSGSSAILLLFLFLPAVFSANSFLSLEQAWVSQKTNSSTFVVYPSGLSQASALRILPSGAVQIDTPRQPSDKIGVNIKANAFYVVSRLNRR